MFAGVSERILISNVQIRGVSASSCKYDVWASQAGFQKPGLMLGLGLRRGSLQQQSFTKAQVKEDRASD